MPVSKLRLEADILELKTRHPFIIARGSQDTYRTVAIRLVDPRELDLPDLGPMIVEDAETGEQLYVDTHDRGFRARFATAVAARERALTLAFGRAGVDAATISTDEDLVRAIVRIAARRRLRRA